MELDKKIIGNRIKKERNNLGITQEELAIKLGLNNKSSISQYENGDTIPSDDIKLLMSNLFNCTIDYLLGKSDVRNFDKNISFSDINRKSKFYNIPVYGKISAGQPNWSEECLEGYLPIDPELMGIVNPEEHYFLKVNGESMNKIIQNGSFALIHKQDYVENGDIAVVLVNRR